MRRILRSLLLPVILLPVGWPHHLLLGVTDSPGHGHALRSHARVDARYQYLAGGVNTGNDWTHWNPNGTFASNYVRESISQRMIPVLTFYEMLQSKPSVGGDERARDLSNLRNRSTMRAYWADYSLLLRRVAQSAGRHTVVIHVEPDLWGYLEQAHAVKLARSFARHLISLRNKIAPHARLAWHLSTWGTGEDPTYSKPSAAHMDALAAKSAAFYESLHAHFDLVFNDVTDRDAGFYQHVENNPHTWWGPDDFVRHDEYIAGFTRRTHEALVLWQLPVGDTMLNDTWNHYRDNRLQWWLSDPHGPHLKATRNAGVIGLLFGGGADGTTEATSDGGFFYRLARRYASHPLALGRAFRSA